MTEEEIKAVSEQVSKTISQNLKDGEDKAKATFGKYWFVVIAAAAIAIVYVVGGGMH